jgi:hypothetical protein
MSGSNFQLTVTLVGLTSDYADGERLYVSILMSIDELLR